MNFDVPPGACDCHVHVFGDPKKYPFFAGRTYTPETASVDELRQLLAALRLERVVIVQPSVYGTDNSCTLDGMRALGSRARGVAVIDDKTTDAELDAMGKAGIRGIRLNLATAGINDPDRSRGSDSTMPSRAREKRGWHIQFNTQLPVIEALSPQFLASPVPLVIDHFGGATAARGLDQPGFGALVNLVKSGKAYVKISGSADSVSTQPDLADVAPFARALVAGQPAAHPLGHQLAPPGLEPGRRPQAHRSRSSRPDRRRESAESFAGLGTRRGHASSNPRPRTLRACTGSEANTKSEKRIRSSAAWDG